MRALAAAACAAPRRRAAGGGARAQLRAQNAATSSIDSVRGQSAGRLASSVAP